mgnify:CR=1 FL=1
MRSLKYILCLMGGMLYSGWSFSQYTWDGGVSLGGANYTGEMDRKNGQAPPFMVQNAHVVKTRPGVDFFIRYRIHTLLSAKAGVTFLGIAGTDSLSNDPYWRGRNLHFRNRIY